MTLPIAVLVLALTGFQPARTCLPISSDGRLHAGADFAHALPGGLRFRLHAEGPYGWTINVLADEGDQDFVWVVSPPYQTAPHLSLGPVYGMSATDSAAFARDLRFVLNRADYRRAFALYEQWRAGAITAARLNAARSQIATGTLTLSVTNFAVRRHVKAASGSDVEAFDWIQFTGTACIPSGGDRWIP